MDLAELVDNRFKAAELYGRLANIRADLPAKLVRSVGLFQELTGGRDTISAERKHQHPFQFRPTAKLLFSANRLPRIPGVTPAFWVRWVLLPFEVEVPREVDVTDYAVHLMDERDGIFHLMLEGSRRLLERGRLPDLAVDVQDRWLRNSDPALWVCQREIEDRPDGEVAMDELLQRVLDVCEEEGVDELPEARAVGSAMRRAQPKVKIVRIGGRRDRRTLYRGASWAALSLGVPPVVGPRLFSDEKTGDGATGELTTIAREVDTLETSTGVAEPPSAPVHASPSETSGPARVETFGAATPWATSGETSKNGQGAVSASRSQVMSPGERSESTRVGGEDGH